MIEPFITYQDDVRIVMTMDAGGTNMVFTAIQGNLEIVNPVTLPTEPDHLDRCLYHICLGFEQIASQLPSKPVAISFAFPGPADYPNGIIDDLPNLPAFRGGVALGPMLERRFDIPVYINNDGDLFTYGEALAGLLPKVNRLLINSGALKQYNNLFGITLGTGFGGGFVRNGSIVFGDNSAASEIWLLRNNINTETFIEEDVSIRGIRRNYAEMSGIQYERSPSPEEIFLIAGGHLNGNTEAALQAFDKMGKMIGDALANIITLIDGLIVIGGGLAGAYQLFMPSIINEMNRPFHSYNGELIPRTELKVYNLEDEVQCIAFLKQEHRTIPIPGTNETIKYNPIKRTGLGISVLGTNRAVAIGAYAFALQKLDE